MSVPNQTPYIIYNANGLTTVFPFEFYIINSGDIQVSINGTTVTSGYSVSGTGNVGGGDVTFITPPASGSVVMLERVVPTYRLTDYQDNGDLLADTVNKDFDRLWMAIQRSFIYLGLALRRPLLGGPYNAEGYRIANGGNPVDKQDFATKNYVDNSFTAGLNKVLRTPEDIPALPAAQYRNGKLLGFNNIGNPVLVTPESGSAADVLLQLAASNGALLVGGAEQNYSTVADMVADTKLTTGNRVSWDGYYSVGDGGGNSGIVISGLFTADAGSIFALDNGLYVSAIFADAVDPCQFGISPGRTATQNTTSFNAAISYGLNNKKRLIHKTSGTYIVDPIDIEGSSFDWFWWECGRGEVTLVCNHTTKPLLTLRGVQISNTDPIFANTFQYCTVKGFRLRSPYIMLRYAFTERMHLSNLIFSGIGDICDAIVGPSNLREYGVWDILEKLVFGNCNRIFVSGVAYQSEAATKHVLVGDSTFRDWDAQNCGFQDNTYVFDGGYFDGGLLDNLQFHMNAAASFTKNVRCLRMYKPSVVNFKNCYFWEANGAAVHLLSPRYVQMDGSNMIWGAGQVGTEPGLRISNFDNLVSHGCVIRPLIANGYGSAVEIVSQGGIDLSGMIERDNCKAGNTIPGVSLNGCDGIKMHNLTMQSSGGSALNLIGSNIEVFNISYSGYTSQSIRTSSSVKCLPANAVRQVSTVTNFVGIFDDEIQCNASAGASTVTLLPASDCPGKLIRVVKTDSSANGIQIAPASGSGNTINGAGSYSLTAQYAFVYLRSTGNNWVIVGKS